MILIEDGKLEYALLEKGDQIGEEVLVDLIGCKPNENPEKFTFQSLHIKKQILKQCNILTRGMGNDIRLLTDTEAVIYTNQRWLATRERLSNITQSYKSAIDENNLSPEERLVYGRNSDRQSRIVSAMQSAEKLYKQESRQVERNKAFAEDKIKTYGGSGK